MVKIRYSKLRSMIMESVHEELMDLTGRRESTNVEDRRGEDTLCLLQREAGFFYEEFTKLREYDYPSYVKTLNTIFLTGTAKKDLQSISEGYKNSLRIIERGKIGPFKRFGELISSYRSKKRNRAVGMDNLILAGKKDVKTGSNGYGEYDPECGVRLIFDIMVDMRLDFFILSLECERDVVSGKMNQQSSIKRLTDGYNLMLRVFSGQKLL